MTQKKLSELASQGNAGTHYPRTRMLTLAALFACLLSIFSLVSIPIAGQVPLTLQVFAVLLSTMILGPKVGTLANSIYLLLGAFGLPVFAGMTSGIPVLFGPNGGYLFGFVIGTFVGGLACAKRSNSKKKDMLSLVLAAILVLTVIYSLGVSWLAVELHLGMRDAILLGAVPFAPLDALKAAFAIQVALQVRWSRLPIPVHS